MQGSGHNAVPPIPRMKACPGRLRCLRRLPARRAWRQLLWRSTGPKSYGSAWPGIPARGRSWCARSIGASTALLPLYRQRYRRRGSDPGCFPEDLLEPDKL